MKLIILSSNRDHGLRSGRPPTENQMRSDLMALANPSLRLHLRLMQIVEKFVIQEFRSHTSIEAVDIAVFPRAVRLNIGCDRTCIA